MFFMAVQTISTSLHEKEWLVPGILLKKGVTFFGGSPGAMKSFLSLYLTVTLSQGRPLFNFKQYEKPIKVLYLDEENAEDTIRVRLELLKNGGLFTEMNIGVVGTN